MSFFKLSKQNARKTSPDTDLLTVPTATIIHKNMPPFGPVYNLSMSELETLRGYLDENLANGFIVPSSSPVGSSILFVKKKNGSLRLCVDYRELNAVTIKNRYSLFLISQFLVLVQGATIFTKLDLRSAYHSIRIRKDDEWKTAFRCRYRHYEYRVMPFGLTNASATFQAHIHVILREFLDFFLVVYLNDILIFFKTKKEHAEHVRLVLSKLRAHKLYANLEKCQFFVEEIEFLGFLINKYEVKMDPGRVSTIVN